MTALFSYLVRYDTGAAPNPFGGICTLAICKPKIRQAAIVGDWVIGTGSSVSPIGDISSKVVYAMRVTQKMTMEEYDRFTLSKLPLKIPLQDTNDLLRRYGDSIYDFSSPTPSLRPSVHNEGERKKDLEGCFVLLSDYFFYFGDKPVSLPETLQRIIIRRGYKSKANAPCVDDVIRWLHSLGYPPASLIGEPLGWVEQNPQVSCEGHTVKQKRVVKAPQGCR